MKAQQKAFDIESNRITFAQHKSFHKMLIRDAIKKMQACYGSPYSAWDMWLIDAKCMLERVLREWPAPKEVTLSQPPSLDVNLVGEIHDIDHCYMAVWKNGTPDVGTKLYAAPPSIDALIAEIDDEINMERSYPHWIDTDEIERILDKYRGVK